MMDASRESSMNGEAHQGHARGIKRQADDSLDDEQRFAKRFNLLNLDSINKLYIPISSQSQAQSNPPTSELRKTITNNDDGMQVDDTKDRIYIRDLDEEIADIESEEEKLVFLPDIEKKLGKIPQHILKANHLAEAEAKQLILYRDPASLLLPPEHDSVRKAIIESRQRAHEKMVSDAEVAARARSLHASSQPETAHGFNEDDYVEEDLDDLDAMDIG